MLLIIILLIFILGYALITLEDHFKINKSATALLLAVVLWVLYTLHAETYVLSLQGDAFAAFLAENPAFQNLSLGEQIREFVVGHSIRHHVAEISEIILFLMGAMTIVELIDEHGGFNFVNHRITTRNSVKLLWLVAGMSFGLSAILDNLTTAIVMVMVLRKLISDPKQRWLFASIVILSCNAGGAFSPIGDITTIMLWIKGNISSLPTIRDLFLPSLVATIIPLIMVSFRLKGCLEVGDSSEEEKHYANITRREKITIFVLGVGGLMSVPIFRAITGLPPFIGILGVLAILWLYTELMYRSKGDMEESVKFRVSKVIKHIDLPTILFFFGILLSVGALQEVGLLQQLATYLDNSLHNVYAINGLIGILSSIVDNVPLVAGAIGMYPVADSAALAVASDPTYLAHFCADGMFWQLLAYCAGVGGSILIIGSAAGVVVMGLEKINFMWYLKNFSLLALIGYLAGIGAFYLQSLL